MGLGLCSVPLSTPYPSHGELFPLISDELLVSGSLSLLFCLAWWMHTKEFGKKRGQSKGRYNKPKKEKEKEKRRKKEQKKK